MAAGEKNKPENLEAWREVEVAERWEIVRRREGIPLPAAVTARLELAVASDLDDEARETLKGELAQVARADEILLRKFRAWSDETEDQDSRSDLRGQIEQLAARLEALRRWVAGPSRGESDELPQIKELLEETIRGLGRWRARFDDPGYKGPEACFGLALSGGGIRSATFNLGVLQALHDNGRLDDVDFLSSVSGGGYIGCSLTYLTARDAFRDSGHGFPLSADSPQLAWIRRHTRYLTPGDGMNVMALLAAYLRGFLINLALLIPPFVLVLWLLNRGSGVEALPAVGRWAVGAIVVAVVTIFVCRKWFADRPIPDAMRSGRWWSSLFLVVALAVATWHPEIFSGIWWLVVPIALTAGAALLDVTANILRAYRWAWLLCKVADLLLGAHDQPRSRRLSVLPFEALSWIGALGLTLLTVEQSGLPQRAYPAGFLFLLLVGLALIGKYLISQVFLALLSGTKRRLDFQGHRYFSVQYGDLLGLGGGLLLLGAVPQLEHWMTEMLTAGISIGGALSTAVGWFMRSKADEQRGYVAILLRIGLALLIVSGLLWLYHLADGIGGDGQLDMTVAIVAGVVWLIAVGVTDINYVSMHRYYRNRLMEAYFCEKRINEKHTVSPADTSDNLDLANIDVGTSGAPYPLINTNVMTVGYEDEFYRLRGGDSFLCSPRFVGSDATTWTATAGDFSGVDLATAMAVSGAAVDPNTGETRSWSLRVVMAALNARLGYWLQSPRKELGGLSRLWSESWTHLILREMIAMPKANSAYVRLSDGGHFENLGLYELVRRRCRLIIVSDAGADPDFDFADLTRAVERLRVDFGARVELDITDLRPDKETRCSHKPFVTGQIFYADGTDAVLAYLKTTLFEGLAQDVAGYAKVNKRFPDETTADQFFSEEQFEAYRELGYRAADRMVKSVYWP